MEILIFSLIIISLILIISPFVLWIIRNIIKYMYDRDTTRFSYYLLRIGALSVIVGTILLISSLFLL